MKRAFVWALLVFATNAFAVEKIKSEKHFQFLNLKCEASLSYELDASPQSPPLDIDDPGTPGCNRWKLMCS